MNKERKKKSRPCNLLHEKNDLNFGVRWEPQMLYFRVIHIDLLVLLFYSCSARAPIGKDTKVCQFFFKNCWYGVHHKINSTTRRIRNVVFETIARDCLSMVSTGIKFRFRQILCMSLETNILFIHSTNSIHTTRNLYMVLHSKVSACMCLSFYELHLWYCPALIMPLRKFMQYWSACVLRSDKYLALPICLV